MTFKMRPANRRQVLRSLLSFSLGERLLGSPRELSDRDVSEAIKYGRKWRDGNSFLVEGLEPYRSSLAGAGSIRITVTFLTDWARIALASALLRMDGKEADPANWRLVASAARLVTMALIVTPGAGRDALAKRLYGDGKAYSVIRIDGSIVTPTTGDNLPPAGHDRIPSVWVPTVKQLSAMIHNTKGSEAEFTRIVPQVDGIDASDYQLLFLLNSYQLDRDQWARKAEFVLFDADGRGESAKVNLSKLR